MKNSLRAGVVACTLLAGLSVPVANADTIDRALAAVPSGQISCEQASRYWTNTADYNNKVAQARAVATFDRRGPQILDALARIDEAANRCGLKGGGAPAQGGQGGQGGQAQGGQAQGGAPSHGAPAAEAPGVNPAPAPQGTAVTSSGQPATQIYVPVVDQWITVSDLYAMVRDFLGRFGVHI
ncbi:hypothetical protein [Corynebacterium frankenforstense]